MKKIIVAVFCVLILVPTAASAQIKEEGKVKEPATKLEAFLAKKGKLIVKDFYKIGAVNCFYGSKMEVNALVIFEPGQEGQRIRGLKIEVTEEEGEYGRSNTSFLDLEEVESLSKAIEYMVDISKRWKGINKEYTEIKFSTKGDFDIGFWVQGTETFAFSSSGYIGKVSCFFSSMEDLSSVKVMVDSGLKLLSEK